MSTFDYTKMRTVASRLLDKFGADQTLYNHAGTPTYTVKAVFLPLETSNTKEDDQIERDIQSTVAKRCVFYSATSISPVPGWYITHAGEKYTIAQITEIQPTSTVLYYDCVVER